MFTLIPTKLLHWLMVILINITLADINQWGLERKVNIYFEDAYYILTRDDFTLTKIRKLDSTYLSRKIEKYLKNYDEQKLEKIIERGYGMNELLGLSYGRFYYNHKADTGCINICLKRAKDSLIFSVNGTRVKIIPYLYDTTSVVASKTLTHYGIRGKLADLMGWDNVNSLEIFYHEITHGTDKVLFLRRHDDAERYANEMYKLLLLKADITWKYWKENLFSQTK